MPSTLRTLALATLLPLLGCDRASAAGGGESGNGAAQPPAAEVVDGRPQGLFFMTRFWLATNSLEKVVWYFAPDGGVYQNLDTGFSEADLAAHTGARGTYAVSGDEMVVTWADGSTSKSTLERDGGAFTWDMGIFTPVKPFKRGASLAGTYEGGESFSTSAGNGAIASRTLELREDGTYTSGGAASVQSTTSESQVTAGGTGGDAGQWRVDGYSLTLAAGDGTVTRRIAFPYDDEKTDVYPDRMFFGGTMYNRQQRD